METNRYVYKVDHDGGVKYFSTSKKAFDYCSKITIIHKHFAVFNRWLNQYGYYENYEQKQLVSKIELY